MCGTTCGNCCILQQCFPTATFTAHNSAANLSLDSRAPIDVTPSSHALQSACFFFRFPQYLLSGLCNSVGYWMSLLLYSSFRYCAALVGLVPGLRTKQCKVPNTFGSEMLTMQVYHFTFYLSIITKDIWLKYIMGIYFFYRV